MTKTLKLSALLFLSLFLSGLCAHAQDLSIQGDTIRVSSSAYPMLKFMGEVRDYNTLCGDYKLVPGDNTITIRPATSKPVKVCLLIVSEGSKNSPRQHQFVILYDKETNPAKLIHDYSTKDLMEERIAYLKNLKNGGSQAQSASDSKNDAGDSKKEKKKKRHHKKDKNDSDSQQQATEQTAKSDPSEHPDSSPSNIQTPTASNTSSGSESGSDASTQQGDVFNVSDIPEEQIKGRVKQKINAFYRVCENLCEKVDVDGSIKYGMKLFDNNEDAIVATSSSNSKDVKPQKIRQYFIHLSQLNYKRVEMTASEIKFVSNFHKGPDGKWHASAVIIQDFKGYKDYNILAYKDQTTKTVDIIISLIEEVREGKTIRKFDIFLGNISVTNVAS
ncbi:MAG: hypothetical protein JST06_01195 [Bacteroidetes bacterium]|nr:hypothetical protein [Bacteroidota bacterium]MBS1629569.1 hypothetical protein [Bacteroidota bacterium]